MFPVGKYRGGREFLLLMHGRNQDVVDKVTDPAVPELLPRFVRGRILKLQWIDPRLLFKVMPADGTVTVIVLRILTVLHDMVLWLQSLWQDDIGKADIVKVDAGESVVPREFGRV